MLRMASLFAHIKPSKLFNQMTCYPLAKSAKFNTTAQLPKTNNIKVAVIANRSCCAATIKREIKKGAADTHVWVFYTEGDKNTPVVRDAIFESRAYQIQSYMDIEGIKNAILILQAYYGKGTNISVHPGWGFLSENADFPATLAKVPNVLFAGPNATIMAEAGLKINARNLANKVVSEAKYKYKFNPPYRSVADHTIDDLQGYLSNLQVSNSHTDKLHTEFDSYYRTLYKAAKDDMGVVMIKANAGGGGRGIRKFDTNILAGEQGYIAFVAAIIQTRKESELFGNTTVMIEKAIPGTKKHLELQLIISGGEALVVGIRDCTAQLKGQKLLEHNVISGDYPDHFLEEVIRFGTQYGKKAADSGYTGLATVEFIVEQEQEKDLDTMRWVRKKHDNAINELTVDSQRVVFDKPNTIYFFGIPQYDDYEYAVYDKRKVPWFLEMNTRMQVEHQVTGWTMHEQAGKDISLPYINEYIARHPNKTPTEVLKLVYGIENPAIFHELPQQRVLHVRICATVPDIAKQQSLPSTVSYATENTYAALQDLFPDCLITSGGIGDGKGDPMFATLSGSRKSVENALSGTPLQKNPKLIHDNAYLLSLDAAKFNARNNFKPHDNVSFLLHEVLPRLFTQSGEINPDISTDTFDQLVLGAKQTTIAEKQKDYHARYFNAQPKVPEMSAEAELRMFAI